ncbi:MAG: hypothetical protein ACI4AK_08545 [Lepagella sp.]
MKIRRLIGIISVAALLLMMGSCENEPRRVVYTHFEEIGLRGWAPTDIIVFEPMPADSIMLSRQRYDLDMIVRYSKRICRGEHIPLAVGYEDERGTLRQDTIDVGMQTPQAEEAKEMHGTYEVRIPLERAFTLSEGYAVTLTPLVAQDISKGILNIGLILSQSEQQ